MNIVRWWPVLAITALVAFISALDNNIVAAAAPSMGRELGLGVSELQWIALGYMIPFAVLLLLTGSLIDRWGQRRTLTAGLVLFGLGAVIGGISRAAEPLVLARVVQGCAAAFIVPGTLSLLRTNLSSRRRTIGAAVWTAALAVALAVGPAAGGYLSQYLHWSWVFYCNIPFVLAALVLLPLLTCADRSSGGGSILAVWRERGFAGALSVQMLWGLGISGIVFFTPLVHQDWVGLSPMESGLPLVLVALTLVMAAPVVPAVVRMFGPRLTICCGLVLCAAGLAAMAAVNGIPSIGPRVPGLVLTGIGSAFTVPLTSWSLELVEERQAGIASGLLTAARELSSALGVALVGVILSGLRFAAISAGATSGAALATGYTGGLVAASLLELIAAALAARILIRQDKYSGPVLIRDEVLGAQ